MSMEMKQLGTGNKVEDAKPAPIENGPVKPSEVFSVKAPAPAPDGLQPKKSTERVVPNEVYAGGSSVNGLI